VQLSDFLTRLTGVRSEGDQFVARCPAHDDSRPSLVVSQGGDGRILVSCRAGCQTAAVLDALNLTWSDLFTGDGPDTSTPTLTAVDPDAPIPQEWLTKLATYVNACAERLTQDHPDSYTARTYLHTRFGIDLGLAEAFRLGVDPGGTWADFEATSEKFYRKSSRLVVPFLGFDGIARGCQGRDLTGHDPQKWSGLKNVGEFRWSKLAYFGHGLDLDYLIITEGPGDALTAAGANYDSLAVRGAGLSRNGDLLRAVLPQLQDRKVLVAGDNDPSGQGFNTDLAEALSQAGIDVRVLVIPESANDLTAWREQRTATFTVELDEAVEQAEPYGTTSVSPQRRYTLTEVGNAQRVRDRLNGLVRFTAGDWMLYDGTAWRFDTIDKVGVAVQEVGLDLWQEGQRLEDKSLIGWGLRSQSSRVIDGTIKALTRLPGMGLDVEKRLNKHPHLLAFRNGVVDLRTGELRPHDPSLYLSQCLDLDYRPDATAPRWESFLAEVFPDNPELPDYLRHLVGYGITGETSEQVFAVLWGRGANGKSVFLESLRHVFGDITRTASFETFEARTGRGGGPSEDLASLHGGRLVLASEGEQGARMAESLIKRVTGGEAIRCRRLYRDGFTFTPEFLVLLATNAKPEFRGQDEGLWRRVNLIPFTRYFRPEERDLHLARKLRNEAEGIAAWAVQGAQDWYANGLLAPEIVQVATTDYRYESDELVGFYPGVIIDSPGDTMLGSEVMSAYIEWAHGEGIRTRWDRRTLYRALEERGLSRKRMSAGFVFLNVRKATPADSWKPLG
jgi:putative DNA primase/helicase